MNLTKGSRLFYLFCLSLFFASCSTYKPSYIPTPNIQSKGDVFLEANLLHSFGGNIAYSPIDKLYLLADASLYFPTTLNTNQSVFVNQDNQLVENVNYANWQVSGALGSYWEYNPQFQQDFAIGYGQGVSGGKYTNFNWFFNDQELKAVEGEYQLFYTQSNLRFNFDEDQAIVFTARLNYLNYDESSFRYVYDEPFWGFAPGGQNLPPAGELSTHFLYLDRFVFQFGIGGRYRLNSVELFGQFQLAVQDTYARDFFRTRRFNVFAGVSIPLKGFKAD